MTQMALISWTIGKSKERITQRLSIQKRRFLRHEIAIKGGKKLMKDIAWTLLWMEGTEVKVLNTTKAYIRHSFKRWLEQSCCLIQMKSHFLLSLHLCSMTGYVIEHMLALVLSCSPAVQFSWPNQQNTISTVGLVSNTAC